jgi:uncharacterized membrane protein YoaK (UPF0700 family)
MTTNGNRQAVGARVRDLLLDTLTISSGATDSISWFALGGVFSAFMTGNVAFLGLRIAGARSPGALSIVIALVAFALGVYLAAQIVKRSADTSTWPRVVTQALALSLIPHAFFVAVWFANNAQPSTGVIHVLIGLWAVAMGMQSGSVRNLRVEGVFTTAATATIIILASDLAHWSGTIGERRRLASVLLSLLIGATVGGVLLVHARIFAPAFPFLMTLATVTTATLVFRNSGGTPQRSGALPTGGHA